MHINAINLLFRFRWFPALAMCRAVPLPVFGFVLLLACPRTAVGQMFYLTGLEFDALTYHSGVLFWKADCVSIDPVTRIQRTASGGQSIHTYYQPATCEGLRVRSRNLAVDANRRVFWATGDGRIATLAQDATPGVVPTILSTLENNAATSVMVALSRDFIYWTETFGELAENGKIFRAPINGGAREQVLTLAQAGGGGATWLAAATVVTHFALPPTEVVYYRRSFGALQKAWIQLTAPWTVDQIAASVQAVSVADGRLWFAESSGATATAIRSLPLNNSLTTTLQAQINPAGVPSVSSVTADANSVYWQEIRGPDGPIQRRTRASVGFGDVISGNFPPIPPEVGLVSDGNHVMWGSGGSIRQSTILRLPVDAAAVTRNLTADLVELIQAVQEPGHSVPFVAGKPAWARIHGRIAESSIVEWRMLVGAVLRGYRNGVELAGSPLTPKMGMELAYDLPHSRRNQNDGWWFEVPAAWMSSGLVLKGEINPFRWPVETTYADNIVEAGPFQMSSCKEIDIYIHPLRTHQGVISQRQPGFEAMEDLTLAMLPTARVNFIYAGGPVIEEWQGSPNLWSFGPYELSIEDDDSAWVLAKLILRAAVFKVIDHVEPGSNPLPNTRHHAALFHTFPKRAFNGYSLAWPNVLISHVDLGGDPVNRPVCATTLVHELGHQFWRRHIDCGGPAKIDPNYPYPPCHLDTTDDEFSHHGFNPLSRTLILPRAAGDVMSYRKRRWISDYTWRGMFDHLKVGPQAAPLPEGPQSDPTVPQLLVTAMLAPDGSAVLEPVQLLPDADAVSTAMEILDGATEQSSHLLRVVGAGGIPLAVVPVSVFEGSDPGVVPAMAIIDEHPDAVAIEFVATAAPAEVVASGSGGGAPPVVEMTAPAASEVAGETLEVRWTAHDPDGDALWFSVRYTPDGGDSWRLLSSDLRIGELDVPMADLPGGGVDQARVEVMASDGLLTGRAMSPPFTVPRRVPRLVASIETPSQRHCTIPNPTLRPGDPLRFHGSGHDPEDGALAEDSFGWTLAGPTAGGESGRSFTPPQLRPGDYTATFAATDSDGMTSQVVLPFVIAPVRIQDLPGAPVIDGVPDLSESRLPSAPFEIRHLDGSISGVRLARHGNFIYITVAGIPESVGAVVVSADSDGAGGTAPAADDLRFIAAADGALATERGNGTTFVRDPAPIGFTARSSGGDGYWHAELQIALNRLGAWDGRRIGLDVALGGHRWFDGGEGDADQPSSWATVELGADVNPWLDSDGDGLPDAWELEWLGTLDRDGSGDLDGDGMSDAEEYQAGTDPDDPTSRFQIASAVLGETGLAIRWNSRAGHCYDIEVSDDLIDFVTHATNVPGNGEEIEMILPVFANFAAPGSYFARLRARRVIP